MSGAVPSSDNGGREADDLQPDTGSVSSITGRPLTKRGEATRRRLLEAAEDVFAQLGYHDASIVKVTERAGVGLGTFYLYFESKQAIFESLVLDLNSRVRHAMSEAMAGADSRAEAEGRGFAGFFRFTAEHPALYRVVREAATVSPEMMRTHYSRIVEGYLAGLQKAQQQGEVDPELDPAVTAWALMGMGELIGMRYILWDHETSGAARQRIDPQVAESLSRLIANALAPRNSEEEEQ